MRDEQKSGGGLAVVLAVLTLALFCLFALGAFWFLARSQAQKAAATAIQAAELSIEAMENRQEPEEATTPMG